MKFANRVSTIRNVLLFLFGVSIPLVVALGHQVFVSDHPHMGLTIALMNTSVVYGLWAYVVIMVADGYLNMKED